MPTGRPLPPSPAPGTDAGARARMARWVGTAGMRAVMSAMMAATLAGPAGAHGAPHAPPPPGTQEPATGAPAPSAAAPGLRPEVQLQPRPVAPGVYMVQGQSALGSSENGNFIANAGFVITDRSVVVIDALGSPPLAELLLEAIARLTPLPVSHLILTHYHADHIYGAQVFKDRGAQVIAQRRGQLYLQSELAARRLADSRLTLAPWVDESTRLVAADVWVDQGLSLDIGGLRFELQAQGPAHTPDDLSVHLPQRGVSFIGDLAFSGRLPFVGQADSAAWIQALDALLARLADAPQTVLVPGHGPPSRQARADLQLTRDYLQHLRQSMGPAARALEPFDEAYARTDWSRYAGLPLFDVANRMNAYNTYLLMERESD